MALSVFINTADFKTLEFIPSATYHALHQKLMTLMCVTSRIFTIPPTVLQPIYEGYLESKERFATQRYLLIIGKKQNMQVLSHTFTYFST